MWECESLLERLEMEIRRSYYILYLQESRESEGDAFI